MAQNPSGANNLAAPTLGIDKTTSERVLRIIALGRKNFLLAGNRGVAGNLAMLQTLVSTCETQGVSPQVYVTDVLVGIQTHPQSRICELLPRTELLRRTLAPPVSESA